MQTRFPYGKTFLLGFGFCGISFIWPVFNTYVPIFLKELGLSATLVAFVMTWDNYLNIYVQPLAGDRSDRTRTRLGRRKPWILAGAPFAALFFILIPGMTAIGGVMIAILLTNFFMALFRAPTVALLGDVFAREQRSTANGVINLMGGIGNFLASRIGGHLYKHVGRSSPFIFSSLAMLLTLTVLMVFVREPKVPHQSERGKEGNLRLHLQEVLGQSDRSTLWVLMVVLCGFMGNAALDAFISSFGKYTLKIHEGQVGILTSYGSLAYILFAIPAGLLANRFGRKTMLGASMVGLTVCSLYGLMVQNETMFKLYLIPAGMFWATFIVNILPTLYDAGSAMRIGVLTGLYYLASNIAQVAGPQAVGVLIDLTNDNYRVIFVFAVFFALLACSCISRIPVKAGMTPHRVKSLE